MKTNNKKTILLADDDDNLRRVLEYQLGEAGFQVQSAKDGAEAFELYNIEDFDCVITDLRMPKLSGLELLEKIKDEDSEIPVIVITAFGEVETAVTAMKAGKARKSVKSSESDEKLKTNMKQKGRNQITTRSESSKSSEDS